MTRLLFVWAAILLAASPSPAQPVFKVAISSDRSEYFTGEPIRLSVLIVNVSADTLFLPEYRKDYRRDVFLSVSPKQGGGRLVSIREHLPYTRLCPGDSLQFFAQAARNNGLVGETGAGIPKRVGRVLFDQPGDYSIRICCLAPAVAGAPGAVAISNPLELSIRKPSRLDRRIIETLWDLRAIDGFDLRWSWFSDAPLDRERYEELEELLERSRASILRPNLELALAGTRTGRAMRYASFSLVGYDFPDLWPETVTQQTAFNAISAAELEHYWDALPHARERVNQMLSEHPVLRCNPDFMAVANRVREQDGDVAIAVEPDKKRYLIGEPILLRVKIFNACSRPVRVPWWYAWENPSSNEFLGYFEVENSHGDRQVRVPPQFLNVNRIGGDEIGLELAPGDTLVFPLRSTMSGRVQEPGIRVGDNPDLTFPEPGDYHIRVGYVAPSRSWRLSCRGRPILSRPVSIRIDVPGTDEAMILDALRPYVLSEMDASRREDEERLEEVLAARPNHPLSMHVCMALARAVMFRDPAREDALRLRAFEMAAGLWKEEVAADIAWRDGPNVDEGVEKWFLELMRRRPCLWSNPRYTVAALRADGRVEDASRAASYWQTKMYREGARIPSWAELRREGRPRSPERTP